jgi:hypothetical protein
VAAAAVTAAIRPAAAASSTWAATAPTACCPAVTAGCAPPTLVGSMMKSGRPAASKGRASVPAERRWWRLASVDEGVSGPEAGQVRAQPQRGCRDLLGSAEPADRVGVGHGRSAVPAVKRSIIAPRSMTPGSRH